jgi:hypothetical protein
MKDPRSDELLRECGLIGRRLELAFSWTDGLEGGAAKACSRTGSAAWKRAKPLPDDEGAAAAFFVTRARKRNPAVVLGASGIVGVEADGDLERLRAELGVPALPSTVTVRSRRGLHCYYRPPAGRPTLKVQLDPDGVEIAEDGYLVGAGALHASGVVYRYESNGAIAELPVAIYDRLVELGGETRAEARKRFATGEPIREGHRDVAIFWHAVELLRAGTGERTALEQLLALNAAHCEPPLDAKLVEKQLRGAVRFVRANPTSTERARAEARRILHERRPSSESTSAPTRAKPTLWLPFVDVQLTGPPRWLWRGKVPEGAVTLIAGRPKLGKSLLTIWLAAQLSNGLLEGAYREHPARTLVIAAEDPPDPIVKGRLIAAAADQSLVGTLATTKTAKAAKGSLGELVGGLGGLDGAGTFARRIVIPDEYELLEQIVVENAIALVVLDPINSFITAKVDAHRDAEIRRVLDPLAALAARRRFSALAVVHLNRRNDTDVLNRITGSGGYGGSARSILTFGRHPDQEQQRVVAAEGNWQKEAQSDLFEIREVIVFPDAPPEEQTQPALVHVGASELDSADLIDQMADDRTALEEAKDFLLGELYGAPVPVTDLRRGAEAHGISWRTVERAKKLLGVEARRVAGAGGRPGAGRWEWYLELVDEERVEE